jgi:hypothetical protein
MRKLFTLISIAIGYLIKTAIVGIAIILIIPDPSPERIFSVITLLGILGVIYNAYKNRDKWINK